jgi:formate dehydrogenase subunit gamma
MRQSAGHDEAIAEAIESEKHRPGALLPILHRIQERIGYVPETAVPSIAKALNLSRAEVHGVLTFYHYFRTTPRGRHVIQICRAEACQSMGADGLISHAKATLGIEFHATTSDDRFSLEPVYCLGNCACSPSIMINDDLYGRVSTAQFDAIISDLGNS